MRGEKGQIIREPGNTVFVTIKGYSHDHTVHTMFYFMTHVIIYKVKQ